jgi:hypothetical protein
MLTLTLAIDPGRSGGIALRDPSGRIAAHAMPETDADTLDLLREIIGAARRFPTLKPTLATADALLLMDAAGILAGGLGGTTTEIANQP